jgi:hypothetical protein
VELLDGLALHTPKKPVFDACMAHASSLLTPGKSEHERKGKQRRESARKCKKEREREKERKREGETEKERILVMVAEGFCFLLKATSSNTNALINYHRTLPPFTVPALRRVGDPRGGGRDVTCGR